MALLRYKDVQKLSQKEKVEKINEFKLALIRGNVTANKAASKSRELKRAIARLHTFKPKTKEGVEKK